jgi:hypothetical protein
MDGLGFGQIQNQDDVKYVSVEMPRNVSSSYEFQNASAFEMLVSESHASFKIERSCDNTNLSLANGSFEQSSLTPLGQLPTLLVN